MMTISTIVHDVDVGVDDPRQDRAAARIEPGRAIWYGETSVASDSADPPILDQHRPVGDRFAAIPIYQRAIANHLRDHRRSFFPDRAFSPCC
jgi:hypothetical protein